MSLHKSQQRDDLCCLGQSAYTGYRWIMAKAKVIFWLIKTAPLDKWLKGAVCRILQVSSGEVADYKFSLCQACRIATMADAKTRMALSRASFCESRVLTVYEYVGKWVVTQERESRGDGSESNSVWFCPFWATVETWRCNMEVSVKRTRSLCTVDKSLILG